MSAVGTPNAYRDSTAYRDSRTCQKKGQKSNFFEFKFKFNPLRKDRSAPAAAAPQRHPYPPRPRPPQSFPCKSLSKRHRSAPHRNNSASITSPRPAAFPPPCSSQPLCPSFSPPASSLHPSQPTTGLSSAWLTPPPSASTAPRPHSTSGPVQISTRQNGLCTWKEEVGLPIWVVIIRDPR